MVTVFARDRVPVVSEIGRFSVGSAPDAQLQLLGSLRISTPTDFHNVKSWATANPRSLLNLPVTLKNVFNMASLWLRHMTGPDAQVG